MNAHDLFLRASPRRSSRTPVVVHQPPSLAAAPSPPPPPEEEASLPKPPSPWASATVTVPSARARTSSGRSSPATSQDQGRDEGRDRVRGHCLGLPVHQRAVVMMRRSQNIAEEFKRPATGKKKEKKSWRVPAPPERARQGGSGNRLKRDATCIAVGWGGYIYMKVFVGTKTTTTT